MNNFVKSIDPFDEYCFQIRSLTPWKPETFEEEYERREWNLLKYAEYLKNGSRFPADVVEQRKEDFIWLADAENEKPR